MPGKKTDRSRCAAWKELESWSSGLPRKRDAGRWAGVFKSQDGLAAVSSGNSFSKLAPAARALASWRRRWAMRVLCTWGPASPVGDGQEAVRRKRADVR